MKTTTIAFVILFMIAGQGVCEESRFDGNNLLEYCTAAIQMIDGKGNVSSVKASLCVGYVAGLRDMNAIHEFFGGTPVFCITKQQIPNSQLIRIVVKYLQDKPAQLHEDSAFLVTKAFKEAFPCKAGQ